MNGGAKGPRSPSKGDSKRKSVPGSEIGKDPSNGVPANGMNKKKTKKKKQIGGVLPPVVRANEGGQRKGVLVGLKNGIFSEEARKESQLLTQSVWFDSGIGVAIVLNAVSIGGEQSLSLRGEDTSYFLVFETLFLIVYITELTIRFHGFGRACLQSGWVQLDTLLVALGVIGTWIVPAFVNDANTAKSLGILMMLRTARLLRLAKIARLFKRVKEFWILVRGFLNSAGMLIYCCVVLFVCIYVFSCLGIEIITGHALNDEDTEFRAHVQKYFRDLPTTMMTLVRFVVLDNTSEVYSPLIERDGTLALYFLLMILTLSVLSFHLIGSVIFNSTLEQNIDESDDKEQQTAADFGRFIEALKDMFVRLDGDSSGNITLDEFLCIHPNDMERIKEALGSEKRPTDVFNALDVDGSGEVTINEFFDALLLIVAQRQGVEMKRMELQIELINFRIRHVFDSQQLLSEQMGHVISEIRELKSGGSMADSDRQERQTVMSSMLIPVDVRSRNLRDEQGGSDDMGGQSKPRKSSKEKDIRLEWEDQSIGSGVSTNTVNRRV